MPTFYVERTMNLGEEVAVEIAVDYSYSSYGAPARTWGPPEMCDPGSPAEIYVEMVTTDWGVTLELTRREEALLDERAQEGASEAAFDDSFDEMHWGRE